MKTNLFKYLFFIFVISLVIIAIYILYKDKNKEIQQIENNELQLNLSNEMNIGIINYDTLNPILSNNRDIQYIDKLIFYSLIDITKDFKISYSIAKEVSKINTVTYILKLNDNIKWHDGSNVTSRDVIFTIENLMNKEINSIYSENVKNIDKVIQIDDYTIKVILKEETEFFEYMLCFPILSKENYEAKTLKSKTEIPIGTGKYKINKISENLIEIQKNNINIDDKIQKINILIKENTKALHSALIKKEVDYIITDNIMYEEYLGTMGYNVTSSAGRELEYLVFNTENSIMRNKEVRQAITMAIDRNYINYNNYENKFHITNYPLSYGSYLYEYNDIFEYNPSEAKNKLIENGWAYKNGVWSKKNDKLIINLLVNQNNTKREECAEVIKEQLYKVGIIVNIIKVNNNLYNSYVKNNNYDIILAGNIVSNNPSLITYYGDNNLSNYKNLEISNKLNEIKNINNEEKLKEKYKEIQSIYEQELPFMCLYFNSIFVITNTNLKGDFSYNWYNLFYNIDTWYKVIE